MFRRSRPGCIALSLGFLLLPVPATGQIFEAVGTRALGFAGAFVAVADDATAAYWNPAGLASGAFMDARLDQTWGDGLAGSSRFAQGTGPAGRLRATYLGFGLPPFGISYLRTRTVAAAGRPGPAVGSPGNRQEDRSGTTDLVSVSAQHVGVTLVQSVGEGLVVGSTLRLVRGASAGGTADSSSPKASQLDAARGLSGPADTRFDLDVGALATLGSLRLGIAARNVRDPAFGAGTPESRWRDWAGRFAWERPSRRADAAACRPRPGPRGRSPSTPISPGPPRSEAIAGTSRRASSGGGQAAGWAFGEGRGPARWARQGRSARPAPAGGSVLGCWSRRR